MTIPDCINPLSSYWDQPKNTDIEIDSIYAMMSQESFDELKNYSTSVPTGVYAGKMWKSQDRISKVWYLRWWTEYPSDPSQCIWDQRVIIII